MITMWTCWWKGTFMLFWMKNVQFSKNCWILCQKSWTKNTFFAFWQVWLASRYLWSISTCAQRSPLSEMGSGKPVSCPESTLWSFEFWSIQGKFRRFFVRSTEVSLDRGSPAHFLSENFNSLMSTYQLISRNFTNFFSNKKRVLSRRISILFWF